MVIKMGAGFYNQVVLVFVIDSEKVFSRCRSQRLMEWLKGNQNAKEIPENLSFRF